MRCVTWEKDTHGLFDYESAHIVKKQILHKEPGRLVLIKDDIEIAQANMPLSHISPLARPLLSLEMQANGKYAVRNDSQDQQMFIVVRNSHHNDIFCSEQLLHKGDTIKMGRLKFLVKDLRTETQPANIDIDYTSPIKRKQYDTQEAEGEQLGEEAVEIECGVADSSDLQCKICWDSE